MGVGLVPIRAVVGGRLTPHGAEQLTGWHLVPHGNAANRGAGDPRPR
jgi:hypothetical protein